MGDIVDELRDSINAARYSSDSVLASLAVSLGLSIFLFTLFLILRRRIQTLYASKSTRNAQTFPYPGNGIFSWVKPVYKTNLRAEIQPRIGLDAAVYLRFLKMLRNIFLGLALFGCGVGIPINVYFNWKSSYRAQNLSKEDAFVLMTPTLVSGTPMAAHVAVGWVCNFIVILNLFLTFRWILNLRRDYYANYDHRRKTMNRTVMAVDVDKKHRTDAGLVKIANDCAGGCRPINATVGRDVKRLGDLLNQHRKAVLALERAMLREEKARKKGKYVSAESKVEYLTTVKDDLEAQIGQERFACRKENRPLSYGFISYSTQNQAHIIAKSSKGKSVDNSHLRLAPSPHDIIWRNAGASVHQRRSMSLWINIIYTGLVILWIIPAAALGCFLTNFKRIGALWPEFADQMEAHPTGFAILQGVVAPFIMTLVFAALPPLLRKLCKWEGLLTRTDREKEVIRKLFVLFFLINFFIFTCMGVIWDVVAEVISLTRSGKGATFGEVWEDLHLSQRFTTAVIDISSFWVMYLLRSISELFTSLAQILSLVFRAWQRTFTKVTPRDRMEWIEPQAFPYATSYIWATFYTAIALGLTTVQPLCLAVNAIYFSVALPFKKYELMYMYYTKYESNGLFWPVIHNIIIFSTMFGNLVLLCVVWVQGNWKIAMGVAPLPIVMIIYKIVSYYMFDRKYWFFIDASDDEKMYEDAADDNLDELYENPVLYMKLDSVIVDRPDHIKHHASQVFNEEATIAETYDKKLEASPYDPRPYTPPPPPPQVPNIYVNGSQKNSFSPSTCPYPERAMYSGSATSLVNQTIYNDDQNLLDNKDHDDYDLQLSADHQQPPNGNLYQHPNGSEPELYNHPNGSSHLRYYGSLK